MQILATPRAAKKRKNSLDRSMSVLTLRALNWMESALTNVDDIDGCRQHFRMHFLQSSL